jgi:hypothetical protein
MNKEQILKAFPDKEECGFAEAELRINYSGTENVLCLKPKQKFPIVFEDDDFVFKVFDNNSILIKEKDGKNIILIEKSLHLLEQVIEKSREIRKELKK